MDSTADIHACTNRDLFNTLHTKGDFGYVNVGNNLKQKIEGVGRIRLKLHNDKVKVIPDVRYVPTSGANIISLGEFASHGYKYVGIGNWCKVYKGGNLVMQRRKKVKNIYYLDGHALSAKMEGSRRTDTPKTEKRVRFSNKVEIRGTFEKGTNCCMGGKHSGFQSPTSVGTKTGGACAPINRPPWFLFRSTTTSQALGLLRGCNWGLGEL
ncbi:hypothetical protein COCNU_scaffold002680G000010 [Cocos nucifera]|nr:hypothetical protein [Cocos nucifera]